jgi:hypothetical protein
MIETLDRPAAGPVIRLHEADNVVIARANVEIGAKLGGGLTCRSQVPSGHKIATRAIRKGEPILKYNVTIGFAASDIPAGTFVHSHNMEFREFDRDYAHAREYRPVNCSKITNAHRSWEFCAQMARLRRAITWVFSRQSTARPRSCTKSLSISRPSGWQSIRTLTV